MNAIAKIAAAHAAPSKVVFTGKTHTTAGRDGASRSADGFVDVKLAAPHPAAENLFAAAWSACYLGALQLSAAQKKIALPALPEVDAEISLNLSGAAYFLSARFNVALPGLDRDVALELIDAAHVICPYSKAVHGNINVETNLI